MEGTTCFKSKLALHVIEEQFGDIVKDISQYMINYEDCTISSIHRHFSSQSKDRRLTYNQIKESLLVLLHNNCLIVEISPLLEDELEISPSDKLNHKDLIYSLNIEMILNRLRFPQLLAITKSLFDEIGVIIMEEIILNGRISMSNVIDSLKQNFQSNIDSNTKYDIDTDKKIQQTFHAMIQRRLLIAVQPLNIQRREKVANNKAITMFTNLSDKKSSQSIATNGNTGVTTAATVKRRKVVKAPVEEIQSDLPLELRLMLQSEERLNSANSNNNSNSSTIIELNTNTDAVEPPTKQMRLSINASSRGRGRGRGIKSTMPITKQTTATDVLESKENDDVIQLSNELNPNQNTLWMIGWDQYIREERHLLCINIIRNRMEALGGNIVKIILDNSMNSEIEYSQNQSSPMNVTKIYEQIKLYDMKSSIDFNMLRKILELMKNDAVGIVSKVNGTDHDDCGPSYYVNMTSIVNFYRRKTIHQVVVHKYGLYSGRIIELLQRRKYVDQQEISDYAIMPAREARERLYKLYRDNWLNYIEFSKRNDYNPASTYYYWYIDNERSTKSLLDNMYKTILNLRIRRENELERYRNMEISSGINLLNSTSSDNNNSISIVSMTKSLDLLDSSILRLDKTILLLNKF